MKTYELIKPFPRRLWKKQAREIVNDISVWEAAGFYHDGAIQTYKYLRWEGRRWNEMDGNICAVSEMKE